jgi:glycogen debranching enzyme
VLTGVQEAAAADGFNRLPELYCGMSRDGATRPVRYPVSCSPQAWAGGAIFMMLQAVLGILPDAPRGALHIRNPVLRVSLVRQLSRTLVHVLSVQSAGEPIRIQIEIG